MNKLLPLLCCLLSTCGMVAARSTSTDELQTCRAVGGFVVYEVTAVGKPLPTSWEEMPGLLDQAQWKNGWAAFDFMVLVPGAPVIQSEPDVRREYAGHRLFAIARTPDHDFSRKTGFFGEPEVPGRYVITLAADGISDYAGWVPEPEAQLLLRQTGGFQPETQPTASGQAPAPAEQPPLKFRAIQGRVSAVVAAVLSCAVLRRFLKLRRQGESIPRALSIHRISRGGKITIWLTVVWALCVIFYLSRVEPLSLCEPVLGVMILPLGLIDGFHSVLRTRGTLSLEEVWFEYLWMIPNLFILGYGIAAIVRAGGWSFRVLAGNQGR